jgi:hypothetical protein
MSQVGLQASYTGAQRFDLAGHLGALHHYTRKD